MTLGNSLLLMPGESFTELLAVINLHLLRVSAHHRNAQDFLSQPAELRLSRGTNVTRILFSNPFSSQTLRADDFVTRRKSALRVGKRLQTIQTCDSENPSQKLCLAFA